MRALLLALPALAVAGAASGQTADRYGYAPADAQTPMRLAAPRAAPARAAPQPRATYAPATPLARVAVAPAAPLAPTAAAPAAAAPALRTLSWPGKRAAQAAELRAASVPVAPVAAPRPMPFAPATYPVRRAASAPGAYVAPAPRAAAPAPVAAPVSAPAPAATGAGAARLPPPRRPWTERWPSAAASTATAPSATAPAAADGVGPSLVPAPPAVRPAPTPLADYAAPAAGAGASAPVRTASAAPAAHTTARYYSLHKQYGHAPDPDPIPPQFFAPGPDLTAPETPEPARATLTANAQASKAAVNQSRLAAGAVN